MALIKRTPQEAIPRTERGHLGRVGLQVEGEAIPGPAVGSYGATAREAEEVGSGSGLQ